MPNSKSKSKSRPTIWHAHPHWWIALVTFVIIGVLSAAWASGMFNKKIPLAVAPQTSGSPTPSATPHVTPNGDSPTPTPITAAAAGASTPTLSSAKESTLYGTGGTSTAIAPTDSDTTTCTGTVGASCYITFTATGATAPAASLPAQTLSGGTASWTWTPARLQLVPGAYIIQAFVTANGQTTASNQETLYVHS